MRCDVTRHDVARKTGRAELDALSAALRGRHEEIWDFLYEADAGRAWTREQHAFRTLLVFELEECRGPRIPGAVKYWLGKTRRSPSDENRASLRAALEKERALFGPSDMPAYARGLHDEAKRFLAS